MKITIIPGLVICASLFISSCSSGGGDAVPIGDITGSWSVNETSDASACGEGIQVSNYTLDVTSQSGSAITYTSNGNAFNGTLAGNKFTSSGSYPQDGGTTTGSTTLTIGSTCSDFEGTASWSWTDGIESCAGTATLTGSRINSTGCGNAGSSSDSESEPNNFANEADVLTAGLSMEGSTSSASKDDDYFIFKVPASASYLFKLDYDKVNNDINLVLTDSNLAVISFFVNGNPSSTSVKLNAGETVYLVVNPNSTVGVVSYTLKANVL